MPSQEDALLAHYLQASATDSGQQTLLDGLEQLQSILAGNDYETSSSPDLTAFQSALQTFATSPSSTVADQAAVTAAQDLANSLNEVRDAVQGVRQDADAEIATQGRARSLH